MISSTHHDISGTQRTRKVRHSKENALCPIEFESLIEQTYKLKRYWDVEARLILFLAGRLGMRRGEISHLAEEWIDWRQERIEIPSHWSCDRGKDGGRCGTCRQQALQMTDHNEHLTFKEALDARWRPKTDSAARSIPFGFCPRARIALEEFFDEFDRWMYSASVVTRRLNRVVEMSRRVEHCHPHALRATAASWHAGRGIDRFSMCALFGWSTINVAERYVQASADNLDHTLRNAHR